MVTMVYHKQLGDEWSAAARDLRSQLRAAVEAHFASKQQQREQQQEQQQQSARALHVIGRSHKQKVELDEGFVTERLLVNARELVYK
jgi:tRNA (uracil-5-)-methyltransferase